MGRINIFQKLVFTAVLLAAFNFGAPKVEMPDVNMASAQTIPAITSLRSTGRDASTFQSDKALEAACRKSGQDKAVCLCVTYVMKYEMSLNSYRAATLLYGQSGDRSRLHNALSREGYSKSEIELAEKMERILTRANDFAMRCAKAKAYYRTSPK